MVLFKSISNRAFSELLASLKVILSNPHEKDFDIDSLKVHRCRFENLPICSCSYKNFAFLILGILELYTRKACEMFVYKRAETIEYVKN